MELGNRLRELRQGKGLSQGDLEDRTGLLRCYVSRVEHGHTVPSVETLERVAKALDLELYQIFYSGNGDPKAPETFKEDPPTVAEKNLLQTYRRMKPHDQKLLLDFARYAAKPRG
jgi:transcriptional regulator with XRE-family HTH domain